MEHGSGLRRPGARVLDLSMPLAEDTPVYPGDPAARIETAATFAREGYHTTRVALGAHTGTHIDAEAHMIPGGRTLGHYPLERFHGPALLLDLRPGAPRPGPGAYGAIRAETIVLLRTGHSASLRAPDYHTRVPDLPAALLDLLVERRVAMVGVDAGSIDDAPYPVHKALLAAGILIAENLVGLDRLAAAADEAARGSGEAGAAARIEVWALPLRLDLEASPARVVAVVNG
jgi:kynurenine formamidase